MDDVRYSVPPDCLGQLVSCRVEVESSELEVRWGGRTIARHRLEPPGSDDVWDLAHRAAAEAPALGRRGVLRLVPPPATTTATPLQLPFADYDVEPPDLAARYGTEA